MIAENDQDRPDHMIIENTNCYATPDQKGEWLCLSLLAFMYNSDGQLFRPVSQSQSNLVLRASRAPRGQLGFKATTLVCLLAR